ncbi:autotransporter outer membrane beta-barrel domain-containing protein [Pseudomonas sp. PSKL.D1]|uniref:autotransporter outer membrane beta-barrel domain-containing protein n=1 Tax=Pseudomonas sp. PSKL.D1 TaxID=3029060 RepID=UPI0023816723|nr:autotransporter outer membrane beta-barrel domain-containing protein [Pseudomonas sp. PSKL.D1]WDY57219.1 autotransporter outer membrane beta-barrel domain-containing protein [Pseudomonas sp. PSKL.D1]
MNHVRICALVALGVITSASPVMAIETIVLPPNSGYWVREDSPVYRYELQTRATLNVLAGGKTDRIFATDGSKVNIQGGHVSSVGLHALTLSNSHAVIDGSTIIGAVDPATPNATAFGMNLMGVEQASTARVSNSSVSGVGRGINVTNNAVLDLRNTQVEGYAGGPGSGIVTGGAGVVVAGATALVREGSVVSGDNNGIVLFSGYTGAEQYGAKLVLDQSAAVGREGSAIKVTRTVDSNETAQIEINNGSTLSGGNGVVLEVADGARANAVVNNSQLNGNIVAEQDATLDLSFTNHASLTGSIENASSLAIDSTSAWTMTGDSSIDNLALDGGTVNLRGTDGSAGFSRLQLGELSGSGTFMLGTDLATQQGDFLDVTGKASGNHNLLVANTGADPSADVGAHQVVHTGEGSTSQFDLVGGQVDFGTFAYELEQRGDDWFLVRKGDTTTPGARSVTGLFSAAPTVWYGESTTLRGRMGELRNGQEQGGGWLRSYGNKYKVAAGAGAAYDQVQQGIAFGADAPMPSGNGQWLVGVMGGYSRSDLDLSGGTTGRVDSFYLGAYTTWLADDGLYIDALIKANRFRNTSDVRMSDGQKAKGDYDNNGIGASVEVGKHIKLDDGWFVEPFAQGSALWVDGASYNLDNGMRASANNADSLLGKAGTHVGRTFPLDKGGFVQPYVKVAAAHEFARNNQVKINDNKFDNDLSGSRIELGAGVAAQVTDTVQVNAGFDYMKGKNIEQPWGVNLGVRYNF